MSRESPLGGRVALVTGGGTGIGLAISRRLASLGARIAVHQRTVQKAQAAVDLLVAEGGRAQPVAGDLRELVGCEAAVGGCVAAFGRIDVLVNNAAVTGPAALTPVDTLDDRRLTDIVAVNLTATIRCSQLAARAMQSGGVIVNIGSVVGYAAHPDTVAYAATKAGLVGLTRALAVDLADRGIRVVHVVPGDIETTTSGERAYQADRQAHPLVRSTTPLGRQGTPDDVASVVAFACGDEAAFITGTSIVVDGGLLAY